MRNRWIPLFTLVALLAAAPLTAVAEERVLEEGKWYPTAETGVTVTQSAYSDNWAGGDNGSIVWTLIANAGLESQLNQKMRWNNILKLAFGQTAEQRLDADGNRQWSRPEKSTDLIDLESIMLFTLGGYVDPFASVRVESQFVDASDPFGRTLSFNPIKVKESAGIARQFIDEEERSLLSRLGFTFRQSTRSFFSEDTGDATFSEGTNDGGIEWVTDYKTKILEDKVSWTSKLGFYQPVFFSGKSDLEGLVAADLMAAGLDADIADFTTTLDIDWENIFTTQITEYISVQLYVRYLYDKYDNTVKPTLDENGMLDNAGNVGAAVRKAGQFKQTLAIGVTYRFL